MRRTFRIGVLVFLLAAAVGFPTTSSGHGGNATLLHSCVNKRTGVMRLVKPNARCKRSERATDWAIAGPAGPAGAPGAPGPAGATGAQGPTGPAGSIQGAPAGGDLAGTYPNPTIADGAVSVSNLDFDPFTQGEFALFQTSLSTPGSLNAAGNPVDWTKLKGVPAELANGDQVGLASAAAGTGLAGDGTSGAPLEVAPPFRLPQACAMGHVARWNGSLWACSSDGATTYTAGIGLTLTGNQFAADIGTGGFQVAPGNHTHDARYYSKGDLNSAGTLNLGTNPVHWTRLRAVPAGFADGVDDTDGLAAYCAAAAAHPASFPNAPCRGGGQALDRTGTVGRYASIAIGTDGNPVISHYESGTGDLKVARCNDPSCTGGDETTTTVDASTAEVGEYGSLAIGSDGNPVMSYWDRTNGDLKVARCNDPTCAGADETVTVVDSTGTVGQYSSLEIGTDGNPVIAYYDTTNLDLKVARCNDPACAGTGETLSTVEGAGVSGNFGQHASLALGTDGNPVISYRGDSAALKVARCNDPACAGGGETLTVVDSAVFAPEGISIVIGTDGNPFISYHDFSNKDLKVTDCNDPACAAGGETPTTVDGVGQVGLYTSAAIGLDGNPVIAYTDSTNLDLKVARCDDAVCAGANEDIDVVDAAGLTGELPSIAISTDGSPLVAYWDRSNQDLKLARVLAD